MNESGCDSSIDLTGSVGSSLAEIDAGSRFSSTLRKSTGWLSDCSEIVPPSSIFGAPAASGRCASASSGSSCGCEYSSTILPLILWRISRLPSTSISAVTHWSPWNVSLVLFVQWAVCSLPSMTTFVPGVHRLPVVRGVVPSPPRNCTSIDAGNSWSFSIVLGSGPRLLADEAVLEAEHVARERLFVKQVAVAAAVPAVVLVVAHLDHAIGDAERVGEVLAELVAADFRRPTLEVLAVEELDPLA